MSYRFRSRYQFASAVFGITLVLGIVFYAGGSELILVLRSCDSWVIFGSVGLIAFASLLGALNSFFIAELARDVPFSKFLVIFWRSWALGITVPGQIADVVATTWQLKGGAGDISFLVYRLFFDKVITLVMIVGLGSLLPTLLDLPGAYAILPAGIIFLLLSGACIGILFYIHFKFCRLCATQSLLRNYAFRAIEYLPAPTLIVFNVLLTAIKLLASGATYWLILTSITENTPSFFLVLSITQAAGLIAYIPVSFNGLGTVELSAMFLFDRAGVSPVTVLSLYLLVRAITMTVAWIPAIGLIWLRLDRRHC